MYLNKQGINHIPTLLEGTPASETICPEKIEPWQKRVVRLKLKETFKPSLN